MRLRYFVPVLALMLVACPGTRKSADAPEPPAPTATPVEVGRVEIRTLPEIVTAPGATAAIREEKVRAPFPGTVTAVLVTDGDRVKAGQAVATIVARDSINEINGAEEMARQASTPDEKRDADRAVALAKQSAVQKTLHASLAGVVTAHSAVAGDRVSEDQELLSIAASDSVVFVADVTQAQMAKIKPGDAVIVRITGADSGIPGRVETFLPGSTPNFTSPVRIRFRSMPGFVRVGLVGTVEIVVAEHKDVPTVPEAAVLRDDVNGTTRVATVSREGKLHWQNVETGFTWGGVVEIVDPRLAAGAEVITSGQIGLAEGAPVRRSEG